VVVGDLPAGGHSAGPDVPLVAMRGVRKTYGGVAALTGIDFELRAGEVHALMGENGAGKSTLIRILAGAVPADSGEVLLAGSPLPVNDPIAVRRAGIAVIHQELALVPALSAADNLWLGQERHGRAVPDREAERAEAARLLSRLGMNFDPRTKVHRLGVAARQAIEIARALAMNAKVIVMDEPTAALEPADADRLLAIVAELRQSGVGIIYVSHRLEEVFRIADRITVLRDGGSVATLPAAQLDQQRLIELMVGRSLDTEYPVRVSNPGAIRLAVRNLALPPRVHDVSFEVRAGEIVGLVGLVGAGRSETLRALFGAERPAGGEVWLDGRRFAPASPRQAIAAGIGFVPEDRKTQAIVPNAGVIENVALPSLGDWSSGGVIDRRRQRLEYGRQAEALGIRCARPGQAIRTLSGGNQQKAILARWLARPCGLLLVDEPTRGIDVGAKREIYELLNTLTGRGMAVVMATSDLPEALAMADRLVVFREGRVAGEIRSPRDATQEDVMRLAVH
jgi:ribose transport system ATP-binding protein